MKLPKLTDKVPLFRSPRFWAIVFIVAVEYAFNEGLDVDWLNELLRAFELIAGAAAGIKTVDRLGEKIGSKK